MRFLKWVALISGILAGAAAFILAREKKEKEGKALDDYLMNSGEEEPEEAGKTQSLLVKDILSWKNLSDDRGPVVLSFGFSKEEAASKFQDLAAADGYSSDLDSASRVVDILYASGFDADSLNELSNALDLAAEETGAQYQGFHFEH